MDSEASQLSVDFVKCCNCGCRCSLSTSSSGSWLRSVKRKLDEFEENNRFALPGFDYSSVARVEIENECVALREMVSSQQLSIQGLYMELEEERNASSSAASEAMSMILRLQREKAEIQMEARQFKRFAEEKMAHDQQEFLALEDLLYKREQAIQALTCEVQAYKHRMMSYGLTEAEAEAEAEGDRIGQGHKGNIEAHFEFPVYDYPPLKCNLNESQAPSVYDNDVTDIEKYAFGETPHARDLKNLEYRIYQLERSPSSNQLEGDSIPKNILEKVIVGHSPRRPKHLRQFSTGSSSSLLGLAKEEGPDYTTEPPVPTNSFKKMEFFSHTEENSNLRKLDNGSEVGDDMSDRVYTVDSVHQGVPYSGFREAKASAGVYDDYGTTPRDSNQGDTGDADIKKLYMRLQALEADRESMKQAIISIRTDKAQLVLLREIAQHLYKDMTPERKMPVKKSSFIGSFSFMTVFKWIVSFVFWKKKARQSKHMFGLTANNVGLLMLLDRGPRMKQWRCLSKGQV